MIESSGDQPRQKLLQHGASVLSNAELLALIIGTGSKTESVLVVGRNVLASANNALHELGKLQVADLIKINGIGEAKALSIIAAFELGRRRKVEELPVNMKITCSRDLFNQFQFLADRPHEEFWILLLRRNGSIISKRRISTGGVAATVVDGKLVFKAAVELLATGIVLCHNHPSGNVQPSNQDLRLTKDLGAIGSLLDVRVLDHVIIGSNNTYFSFADEGLIIDNHR